MIIGEVLGASCEPHLLASIYAFDHVSNVTRELVALQRPKASVLRWLVMIRDMNGRSCLAGPLDRQLVDDEALVSAPQPGRVVWNEMLEVAPLHRRKGLARGIYRAEDELHHGWCVHEVQMIAMWDGVTVWMKPEFGLQPAEEGVLRVEYEEWAKAAGVADPFPDEPHELPPAFLSTYRDKGLWLYRVVQ